MTREEAIKSMEYSKAQAEIALSKGVSQYWKQEINWTIEAIDMAIEALEREPSEDGTLEVKVEDATKIGRVLISDDKHRGGLYYPDEDEPEGDLISRAEAIEALGEEPPVWCDEEYEIAERNQWRADIEAIKSVPSADRPRGEFDGMIFSTDKYMAFIDKKEIHIMRKGACKVTMERIFNTEEDEE